MRGRAIPESPVFATKSEQVLWESLRSALDDGEVLLHGLRFTDPHDGDIEVDLLLLSPRQGAVIVEVKGGTIAFQDGQWTTTSSSGRVRRIHPVAQARRARHAVRRYLDRQPAWRHDLVRSQWLLAFPHTQVIGDMGPEGRREQIIDAQQVPGARAVIDGALPPNPSPLYGDTTWVDDAVSLLLSAPDASLSDARWNESIPPSRPQRRRWLGIAAAAAFLAAAAFAIFGWPALSTEPATGSITVDSPAVLTPAEAGRALPPGTSCDPAYRPCVLAAEDRNCPDIGFQVFLTGTEDPYDLDRDQDRRGCETYPESERGEAP